MLASAGAGKGLRNTLRREIIRDAALLLGRGRVDQPHQQEEGHHGRHEVGVSHLPGATVVTPVPAFLDALDDDGVIAGHAEPQPSTTLPVGFAVIMGAAILVRPNVDEGCHGPY